MGIKKELTDAQMDYIRENRLEMSMTKMANELKLGYTVVRTFMYDNGLKLTKEEKFDKVKLQKKSGKWIPAPWNEGKNLVTMSRLANLKY